MWSQHTAGPGGRCPVAGVGHRQGVGLQHCLRVGQRWEEGESTEQGKHSVERGWRGDPTQLPRSTSTLLQGREAPHCPQRTEYLTTLSLCQHLAATAATNTRVRAGPCR